MYAVSYPADRRHFAIVVASGDSWRWLVGQPTSVAHRPVWMHARAGPQTGWQVNARPNRTPSAARQSSPRL